MALSLIMEYIGLRVKRSMSGMEMVASSNKGFFVVVVATVVVVLMVVVVIVVALFKFLE